MKFMAGFIGNIAQKVSIS